MKKLVRYTTLAGIAAMLAFGFQNCANPKFSETQLQSVSPSGGGGTDDGDPNDPEPPRDNGDDGSATFTSKIKNIVISDISKVDVLVVIDNSQSMKYEQQSMGARFGSFLDKIDALDWRIAVTTTDLTAASSKNRTDGLLLPIAGLTNRFFLDNKDNKVDAQKYFSNTVQRSETGSSSEQGIAAVYRSVERSLITGDNNATFHRSDAALAVVVVTDADESASGAKNIPENLVSLVSNRWPGKPFIYNAIIVQSDDAACVVKDGNERYGKKYEKMAALTGGETGSVCALDYAAQLASIGTGLNKVVRSVGLDCAPVDSDKDGKIDLKVLIAGVESTAYTVSGSLVTFDNALPLGKVEFSYTCKDTK